MQKIPFGAGATLNKPILEAHKYKGPQAVGRDKVKGK